VGERALRSLPKWLAPLASGEPTRRVRSDGKIWWDVDARKTPATVQLGRLRKNTRLKVSGAGSRQPLLLELDRDSGVTDLELAEVGPQAVTLKGPFGNVTVVAAEGVGRVHLVLGEHIGSVRFAGPNLYLSAVKGEEQTPLELDILESVTRQSTVTSERKVSACSISEDLTDAVVDLKRASPLNLSASSTKVKIVCTEIRDTNIRTSGDVTLMTSKVSGGSVVAGNLVVERQASGRALEVRGAVLLQADTIAVHGSVVGTESRTELRAARSIAILGHVSECTFDTPAVEGVVIGALYEGAVTVGNVSSATGTALAPDKVSGASSQVIDLVEASSIAVEGGLTVAGHVKATQVKCGGRLVVLGDLSLPVADPDCEDATSPSVAALELRLGGSLRGGGGAVSVNQSLHAREISDLELSGDDGLSVRAAILDSVVIRAATLDVLGDVRNCSMEITGAIRVDGKCDHTSSLALEGGGCLAQGFDGTILWTAGRGVSLELRGPVSELTVCPPAGLNSEDNAAWPCIKGPALDLGTFHLKGSASARIEPSQGKNANAGFRAAAMRLDARSQLHLDGANGNLGEVVAGKESSLHLGPKDYSLDLRSESPDALLEIKGGLLVTLEGESLEGVIRPGISFGGGRLEIYCDLPRLDLRAQVNDGDKVKFPEIALLRNRVIQQVSGVFVLAELNGSMFAAAGKYFEVRHVAPSIAEDGSTTLKRLKFREGEAAITGVLVGAYVCELEPHELRLIRNLRVLELARKPLLSFARERVQHGQQARAQHLRDLADLVTEKSVSGGSRAVSRWSAIHSAALALDSRHKFERLWRVLHRRVFGYGYLYVSPLLWLIGWLSALTLALWRWDPGTSVCRFDERSGYECGDFVQAPYSLCEQALRVLLMPLHLLRYDGGGAPEYAAPFNSAAAAAGISLVTALLLGGLILALRNYLRSPMRRNVDDDNIRSV